MSTFSWAWMGHRPPPPARPWIPWTGYIGNDEDGWFLQMCCEGPHDAKGEPRVATLGWWVKKWEEIDEALTLLRRETRRLWREWWGDEAAGGST